MRYKKLITSKLICLSIIWCLISWSAYLNFYNQSNLFNFIISTPLYCINLAYKISNPITNVFSNSEHNYSDIETIAYALSIILCITTGLIISQVIFCILKKLKIIKEETH